MHIFAVQTNNMNYLRFDPTCRSTKPVEYFLYKGEKYPTKEGYGESNECFIYGVGYVKIPSKAKRYQAKPLPENYNANDVIKAFKEYGEYVTFKLIAERYSKNDCVYSGYSNELSNIIKFGESYDAFLNFAREIDSECLSILKEKYGVFIKYDDLKFGDPDCYNTIPAYYINEITGNVTRTKREAHYFIGNIHLSLMFLGIDAQYNPISHEVNLKSMIRELSKVFPILGKTFDLDNDNDCKELETTLENMSVKDMIEALYGADIAAKANELNSFTLKESEFYLNEFAPKLI